MIEVAKSNLSIVLIKDGKKYTKFEIIKKTPIATLTIEFGINQLSSLKNIVNHACETVNKKQGITNTFGEKINDKHPGK